MTPYGHGNPRADGASGDGRVDRVSSRKQEKDALLARTAVPRGRVHNVSAEALCAYFHQAVYAGGLAPRSGGLGGALRGHRAAPPCRRPPGTPAFAVAHAAGPVIPGRRRRTSHRPRCRRPGAWQRGHGANSGLAPRPPPGVPHPPEPQPAALRSGGEGHEERLAERPGARQLPERSRFALLCSIAAFACTSSEVNSSSTASRSAGKPIIVDTSPGSCTTRHGIGWLWRPPRVAVPSALRTGCPPAAVGWLARPSCPPRPRAARWPMLYFAISSCALADSASASSVNSVDSAFARRARILPRIRSSAVRSSPAAPPGLAAAPGRVVPGSGQSGRSPPGGRARRAAPLPLSMPPADFYPPGLRHRPR